MKRRAVLSRAFFRRPAVRELVPDLKLLLVVMTVGCETHVGAYIPAGLAEDAGLDSSALDGGLGTLENRGHIVVDRSSGEVFLTAFFRDNSFDTAQRRRQAMDDFRRIQSTRIRAAVLKAVELSPECGLSCQLLRNQGDTFQGEEEAEGEGIKRSAARVAQAPKPSAAPFRKKGGLVYGVEVWSDDERAEVEVLAAHHGVDRVRQAAEQITLERLDARAFLSRVRQVLVTSVKADDIQKNNKAFAAKRAEEDAAAQAALCANVEAMQVGREYLMRRRLGTDRAKVALDT